MTSSVSSPVVPLGQGMAGPSGVSPFKNGESTAVSRRSYWQEVIRQRPDRQTGKLKYEDPCHVAMRFQEHTRGNDGASLLTVHLWNDRHEKAWMRRKRLASLVKYKQDKQHVMDLAKYIEFVKENSTTDKKDN